MAIYNNGYPATYQPIYQPVQPVTQQSTQNQGLNWIQGEQSAKSYLVAPNSSVVLFDSESQTIYIKSADASGMPSMKILDYSIRDVNKGTPAPISADCGAYATKEDIAGINDQIKALRSKVEKLMKKEDGNE